MTKSRIFISHSSVNTVWCRELRTALAAAGFDTWLDDTGLTPGEEWFQGIARELEQREVCVVVMTPAALASKWVQREIALAFSTGRLIIPIMHEVTAMHGFVTTVQHINAVGLSAAQVAERIVTTIAPTAAVVPGTSQGKGKEKRGFTVAPEHKAIKQYYATLAELEQSGAKNELGLRRAFETLLADLGHEVKWTLLAEARLPGQRARPDATLQDENLYPRGYWEAKDQKDDLDVAIKAKLAAGYQTMNSIFENTRNAVLFQGGIRQPMVDITQPRLLAELLEAFFSYTEPDYASFTLAVEQFKDRVPVIAKGLLEKVAQEHKERNTDFTVAFAAFRTLCQESIDPGISDAALDEMLVQHLLTERLFRTVFENSDFTNKNVIAVAIEKVVNALTSRNFSREAFQRNLDRFYVAIEDAARSIRGADSYAQKQGFLNMIYERFFQGFAVKQADTHGVVYTPQPIVDFMCASVEEVLQKEFNASLADRGVQILDPCTGTGNFMVNLLHRIAATPNLDYKYANDLFCNEIMLLPYYIASMNIEHAYYELHGSYKPFTGACFVDTLTLADGVIKGDFVQPSLGGGMSEQNTERVEREKDAKIRVIIGNPPYNVGQMSENDNNKNRVYKDLDARIRSTYAKDSQATNKNALSDMYVKFFRWATDRLQGEDGIVCFVSNNSFVDQLSFDGMRQHLLKDFTHVWHLDLHGNVRKNPKLSGTTHNVFGIQVGVGITIAIHKKASETRGLWYYRVPEDWRKERKLDFLNDTKNIAGIQWQELEPDAETSLWLTEGMRPEFGTFLPMGSKASKAGTTIAAETIFKTYSRGVATSRDDWAYDFDRDQLVEKMTRSIETYNTDVDRWKRRGTGLRLVDDFVTYDDTRLKWTLELKGHLKRETYATFAPAHLRSALYRPFTKNYLYFDPMLNTARYLHPYFFPTPASEAENSVIVAAGYDRKGFSALMSHNIPDLNFYGDPAQCFPLYTYAEDGSNRRENITDWALGQFQAAYGTAVTKRDIFHYVYAVLHHPDYRGRYAENLKRELPRIPLAPASAFGALVAAGARLATLHTGYEGVAEYPLPRKVTSIPVNWRVTAMKLIDDKTTLVVNDTLRLEGIPARALAYKLGNRSALEWIIDQYRVSTDTRSGIISNPNRHDDPEYIVCLVGKVITVSMETMAVVDALPALGLPEAVPAPAL